MVSPRDLARVLDRLAPVVGAVTWAHIALRRRTGGPARVGHSAPGPPTMLLPDHVGARSGRPPTTPLLFSFPTPTTRGRPRRRGVVRRAHPRHPAWFHNLQAHPDTTVQVRDEVRPVHPRVAGDE